MNTPPDLAALTRDWATIMESELAALATDREARETLQALATLWAQSLGLLCDSN